MMITSLPIFAVDVGGALLMIIFSFLCVNYAWRLKKRDPQNIVWTYLTYVSLALSVFAVSRSMGHIIKQFLILTDRQPLWLELQPYSGAVNSLAFMVVGAITLFFEDTWTIYQGMIKDRQALEKAHQDMLYLNLNLEQRVNQRTAALTLSEQKYRQIFEASRDIILSADRSGRVLDLNPAGFKLLGLSMHKGINGLQLAECCHDPSDWNRLVAQLESQGFISSTEIDLNTADGGRRRVVLSASPAAEASTSDGTIYFLIKDIEDQRQMREQMAQADKLASIGELSAGIAHEINNPLGVILGFTQLMLRHQDRETSLFSDLKTIEKHTRHCKSIVEDLLNFARTSPPKKELWDIHTIIDEVLQFVQQHGKPADVQIQKFYDQPMAPLLVDEKKIKQVFINLIMNAKYAVGAEGLISVRTLKDTQAAKAIIQISDNGCGIKKNDISRIFDPFFTTKPTGEGTGLGLSVSYGIIRNHGGDIYVESQKGRGATFTVELPIPPVPDSQKGIP
jgi:two-component system, NtrC family, sensor kinase